MRKKCIIIGSGLGGLSCGVILAKNNFDVTVLEQEAQLGGCMQCFCRNGAKFETGMHFIGSADKGQTLSRLLHYLEVDKDICLNRLDPLGYDVISLGGEHFRFANGKRPFIEQMARYFPKEKDNLIKYYDLVEQIANASSLHSLGQTSNLTINTEYQTRSINDVLEQLIKDPMLRNVLVGNLPLYAAQQNKTPFSSHAFIMDFYNQSAFRIVGGSDNIGLSLANTIRAKNGTVLTNKRVVHIDCSNIRAKGVTTADGEFYPADIIISDTHPMRTLEMLDTNIIRPIYRKRVNNIPNTISCFAVYLKFKPNVVPYMNSNFYCYKNDSPWDCENYDEISWPKGYLYMHFCHKQEPVFAENGIILSYMSMKEVQKWENTLVGHRGADYELFKQQKARKLLNEVEKSFPELKNNVEHYYTSTPLTYRDYTGTQDGSMYGVIKDVSIEAAYRVSHKTKIPNLLLTGQNTNSHGALGVLIGTIVTCSELLSAERIYKQVMESNK
jgi:Phytoene dehydrogenase and related proteins